MNVLRKTYVNFVKKLLSNIYGKRIDKHLHCGHNLSHDSKLLMVLKAIGGITIDDLSESEKEIAAKVLDCGKISNYGKSISLAVLLLMSNTITLSFLFSNLS